MKKHSYLTGDCKTFLQVLVNYWSDSDREPEDMDWILELTNFYSQPFTKDMIVEPEPITGFNSKGEEQDAYADGWQPLFKGEWSTDRFDNVYYHGTKLILLGTNFNNPDDFIRVAQEAGIKLEWK